MSRAIAMRWVSCRRWACRRRSWVNQWTLWPGCSPGGRGFTGGYRLDGGGALNPWDRLYYSELVRRSSYDFDSQLVRPYFAFNRVLDGVLKVTGTIFGLTYRPVDDVSVWHPSVRVYEVRDGSR